MSVRITIHCDRMGQYGGCTAQLITDARDVDEANAAAEAAGWSVNGTPDFCPTCSGGQRRRPGAHVIHLHPEETSR